jgi:tetratricopeptide (TPR) repeat protein
VHVDLGPKKVGVVFVHGLFSSPKTWSSFAKLIQEDPDLTHIELMLFRYASPIALFNPLRRIPSFNDVADSLRGFLDVEGQGYEQLVLVSHSQGGLVVQRYLARMLRDGRGEDLARISQIVMFACPNSGSDLALSLRRRVRWHPQEQQLRPINEEVTEAQRVVLEGVVHSQSVTTRSCPTPITAFAGETDGIVASTSARGMFRDVRVLPGDHFSIIRPDSMSHRSYMALKQLLLAPSVSRRPPVIRQLPAPPPLFTGRAEELAQLSAALRPQVGEGAGVGGMVVIAAVGGAGGLGKTYLALRWAHDHRERFPDGELYVNLRGFDPSGPPVPPTVALSGFLDALSVEPAAVPGDLDAQIGLYRRLVEGKRMLIVLDNARDTAQVRALLPGSGTCTVLVTSRSQLAGLVTEHAATSLNLGILPEDEAHELLTRRLGQGRITAEPQAAAAVLERCGGLPLALSIVAARAAAQPHIPLAVLAEELGASADPLDALDAGEVTADLRAVFATSYHALEPEAARAFALLGLAPGPDVSLPAAASLIAATIPRARRLLRALEAAHLIRQHAPGRYQFHDLVHLFAAERAHQDQGHTVCTAALRRLADFYLHTAHQAAGHVNAPPVYGNLPRDPPVNGCTPHQCPDVAAAQEWFEAEDACLEAIHQLTRDQGWHTLTWQLSAMLLLNRTLWGRGLQDWGIWQSAIEAAEHLHDPAAQATARLVNGTACAYTGRYIQAQADLEQALALFEEAGDLSGQAEALHTLGWLCGQQGESQRGLAYSERALPLYQAIGAVRSKANSLNSIGWAHAMLGHYDQARSYCEKAMTMARTSGDQIRQGVILDSLAYIAHQGGHYERAIGYYQRSLTMARMTGYAWGEPDILRHLGESHHALGQSVACRQAWRQALDLYRAQHRVDKAAHIQQHLDSLDEQGTIDGAEFTPG